MVEAIDLIIVKPTPGGWLVACDAKAHRQSFQSGATAEAAARQLGDAIARGGQAAEIRIFLRDGSLAGRFACAPTRTGRLNPFAESGAQT